MKKPKTDHMLATYETGDGTWHIQLSSQSGESWGWYDGPYETREKAQAMANNIADDEGFQFDE